MGNTTCFAKRGTKCKCLCVYRCLGYKHCPFYKGNAQYRADVQLTYLRLRSLHPAAQRAIAEQYFHGDMPWAIPDSEGYPSEKALVF